MRGAIAAALVLALPLSGCIVAIDHGGQGTLEKRIDKLEKRIQKLEPKPKG